jgi:beta-lactamase regulating signal transducer with metallopeptidase domain
MLVQLGGGPLGLVAKVSLALALAGVVAMLMIRASAALRHLVWLAGLVASLGIAIAWPLAPRLDVRVRAARPAEVVNNIAVATTTSPTFGAQPRRRVRSFSSSSRSLRRVTRVNGTRALVMSFTDMLVALWVVGALILVARVLVAHVAVARIVRGARPVSDDWNDAAELVRDTGITRNVRILISDEVDGPVTAGFLDPVVIVPAVASAWSDERREIVLTHELAHVARFDFAAQLVASVASAVFWFHPLVWLAAARLRAEAEHAADDRVLARGTAGVNYATHLLDLARVESSTRLSAAVAVGMVRASRLEGRVRAMLDLDRSRTAVSARAQALATSLTLAAVVPIAGLRATSSPAAVPLAIAQVRHAFDSTFEKTIAATSGETLTLDLETGGAITVRGTDDREVRVRARLAGQDWRDTRVSLERWNGGVRLRSEFTGTSNNRSTSHAFEIWVPRHMNVSLKSSGGSLAINDVTGEFRGETGGGSMVLDGASGSARLSTGGGNVRVTNSNLEGSVSTGGGEVIISNVTGGLRASSGSGPVIRVPGVIEGGTTISGSGSNATTTIAGSAGGGFDRVTTISGTGGISGSVARGFGGSVGTTVSGGGGFGARSSTVTANGVTTYGTAIATDRDFNGTKMSYSMSKAGGAIEVTEAPNGASLNTGGGNIWVGQSNGFLGVSTGGGDIDLPRVGGSVKATTGAGDVTITVVDAGNPEHSVDVFTGRGRVVLELPSNLDARFELETAYTESRGRTQIDSDFSLQTSETAEWDDSQGTPRKFVRAQGSVGNGRGLIRIRVVNGDIIIRRGR